MACLIQNGQFLHGERVNISVYGVELFHRFNFYVTSKQTNTITSSILHYKQDS